MTNEVSGLKVVDCYGSVVDLGGDFERVVVNDVEVTGMSRLGSIVNTRHAGWR